jgi:biotin transport system substrate-specific component
LTLECTFFAALVAVSARVAIHMEFTPVPFSMQLLAVVLAGMFLGSVPALLAMLEFLLAGALGAPVFVAGHGGLGYLAAAPTLGYLLAFPLAAYVCGMLAERSQYRFRSLMVAGMAGLVIVFLGGLPYLAVWLHGDVAKALLLGAVPSILPDIAKVALAAGVVSINPAAARLMQKPRRIAANAGRHPIEEIEDWVIGGRPASPALVAHLGVCSSCRERTAAFERSFYLVSHLVEPVCPPDTVRQNLLRRILGRGGHLN